MKELFMFLLLNMTEKFGTLTETSFYGRDHATVKIEKDGSIYSVSISCNDKEEEAQ